ncbi:rCG39105 [Rattus norvegicus]|uniref:RCG39105 n=1 Tax=Rattus norvegicus TaxID=10116 RepID=A6JY00_RAT|nr:rCG39105 [Rattus norvegicus]
MWATGGFCIDTNPLAQWVGLDQATWITEDMECKPSGEAHCKLERGKIKPRRTGLQVVLCP